MKDYIHTKFPRFIILTLYTCETHSRHIFAKIAVLPTICKNINTSEIDSSWKSSYFVIFELCFFFLNYICWKFDSLHAKFGMFRVFSDIWIFMNYCKSWLHCFWGELLLWSCFRTAGLIRGKTVHFSHGFATHLAIIFAITCSVC